MAMIRKPFDEASNAELLAHAQTVMGLDVSRGISTTNLKAKMLAADPDIKEVIVAEEAVNPLRPKEPDAVQLHAPAADAAGEPRIEIMIQSENIPGGELPVQVAPKGRTHVIQRDVWVSVPYTVYQVLMDAVETHYTEQKPDGRTGRSEFKPTYKQSYPVQARNFPDPDLLKAWKDEHANIPLAA